MEGENALTKSLLNMALENAVIEFQIKGDSINGILFIAGETTLLNSKIIERNDSLLITDPKFQAYIIPIGNGIKYSTIGSGMSLILNKTDRTELSSETKIGIKAQKAALKEKEEFDRNLGKWQVGYYVDDFGDQTGNRFAFCIVKGIGGENSISTGNEVYVKTILRMAN